MGKKSRHKQYVDMPQAVNEVADEVNLVLNERKKDKYFQSIILMYSFIENLLKWLVFVKSIWLKSDKELPEDEWMKLRKSCSDLSFAKASHKGFKLQLIASKLYKQIDKVRKERNDIIHQFWIYRYRDDPSVLREELEELANVGNQLVGIFNNLTEEIDVEEVYEILLWEDR